MKSLATALLAALPFSFAATAQAETETLTVIGSRIAAASALPASVTVLTSADWERLPTVDLAGVLARQAGINLRSLYGNGADVSVDLRGFGATASQNTLFLLNGRRLSDLDLSAVDLAALPLSRIQRIEILRGTGGVLYGDGASAGVINIVTENDRAEAAEGQVRAEAGSHDRYGLAASGAFAGDATRLALSGAKGHNGGYRDHNRLDEQSGSAELQRDTEAGRFLFRLDGDEQELELPGARRVDAFQNQLEDDRRGSATPNDYADKRATNATAGYETALSAALNLTIDATLRQKHQEAFFDDYAFGGAFARYIESDLRNLGLSPRLAWALDGQHHDLGLDFSRSDYDSDRSQKKTTAPVHVLGAEREALALYGLSRFELGRGELSLGARWQQVELDASDRLDASAPGGAFDSEAAPLDQDEHAVAWQLGWRQPVSERLQWYAQANRSQRFPTIDEIFQLNTDFAQEFSALDTQDATTYDTGLDYRDGELSARASVFHQRLTDEIHFNPAEFRNINLDPTERTGVELAANWRLTETFALRFAGQWLEAEFRDGPNDGNELPLVPEQTAGLGFDWEFAPAWSLAADARYESERRFDNDETNDFGEQIPSRTLLDAKLAWQQDGWIVAVLVNNLTDKETFDYGVRSLSSQAYNAYPLPEREIVLQVGVSL